MDRKCALSESVRSERVAIRRKGGRTVSGVVGVGFVWVSVKVVGVWDAKRVRTALHLSQGRATRGVGCAIESVCVMVWFAIKSFRFWVCGFKTMLLVKSFWALFCYKTIKFNPLIARSSSDLLWLETGVERKRTQASSRRERAGKRGQGLP